ncbi:hypothetical protein J2T57_001570 [Natronocella acetinitrilica]|uniref:Uncharacterized protein n=1 Tax=Natronocella acetinitrilica TaxID=414046 RepID=A0AAE3G3F7_9GAMM|nr:hypothetical protein [Natronocella acetinitrilica]MCP1674468.1 hypothetical protein [Natronocella acetinitrilica]
METLALITGVAAIGLLIVAFARLERRASARRTGALAGALGAWCLIAVIALGSGDLSGLPLQDSPWFFVLAVSAAGAVAGWIVVEMAFSSMREVNATRAVMRDGAAAIGRSARSTADAVRERRAGRAVKQAAGERAQAQAERDLYLRIASEIENDELDRATWVQAFEQGEGEKGRAEAAYIRLRKEQLRREC